MSPDAVAEGSEHEAASVLVDSIAAQEQTRETSLQPAQYVQSVQQRIKEVASTFVEKLTMNTDISLISSLDIFEKRVNACSNPAQMSSFLRTAGCSLFKRSGVQSRKILCQPTSIARRKTGQPKGKSALSKG